MLIKIAAHFLALFILFTSAAWASEPVDFIVKGRYVVTMDTERRVIEGGAVAIRDGAIVAVDTMDTLLERYKAGKTLGDDESIVIPGLINTHTHIPMTLFRGIADDKTLLDWLNNAIWPLENAFVSVEMVKWGTLLGCWEMIRTGTTTFVDSYFHEDVVADATKEVGMRAVLGHGTSDFHAAEAFFRKWKEDPLIVPAIAPHSVYTCDELVLRASKEMAHRHDALMMIHAAESKGELAYSQEKFGATPVRLLQQLGLFEEKILLAHAVWVDDEELAMIRDGGVGVAYCPESNMSLASGIARIDDMLDAGVVRIGLGTDGAASNQSLDLFEEMNLGAKVQKVDELDATSVPAQRALEIATIGGAKAIHLDHIIGSLEVGKRADLAVISLDYPSLVPFYDVYSLLVYSARGHNVSTVLVDGKVLMENTILTTIDPAAVKAEAEKYQALISASPHATK